MAPALPPRPENAFAAVQEFVCKRSLTEHCELCSCKIADEHEHLAEPATRKLICVCRACAILFAAQSGTRYKRVPREVVQLRNFQISDGQWDGLMVPIEIAQYPSPAGPTESLLPLDTWADIAQMNPILNEMEADLMALLVNRVGYARGVSPAEYYLVPIDECYRLVGLIRSDWRGLSGGADVWREIGAFFAVLKARARCGVEATHA